MISSFVVAPAVQSTPFQIGGSSSKGLGNRFPRWQFCGSVKHHGKTEKGLMPACISRRYSFWYKNAPQSSEFGRGTGSVAMILKASQMYGECLRKCMMWPLRMRLGSSAVRESAKSFQRMSYRRRSAIIDIPRQSHCVTNSCSARTFRSRVRISSISNQIPP